MYFESVGQSISPNEFVRAAAAARNTGDQRSI